jgi:hypothetical protein
MFATGPDNTFVPTKCMLRGWCTKETSGRCSLPTKEVTDLMEDMLRKLPQVHRDKVEKCSAPYHKNWQGVFLLRPGQTMDNVKSLVRAMNDIAKSERWCLNNKELYVVDDKPQWRKDRNSLLARAGRAVEKFAPVGTTFKLDWNSGQLWSVGPRELLVGQPVRYSTAWKWELAHLSLLNINEAEVTEAFEGDF